MIVNFDRGGKIVGITATIALNAPQVTHISLVDMSPSKTMLDEIMAFLRKREQDLMNELQRKFEVTGTEEFPPPQSFVDAGDPAAVRRAKSGGPPA